ncbi:MULTISPECIES: hypothetical protein [Bradyrhizobium]|jgi:hypothetical protein|uniref:hypothetical protein n=1 Tax=Bradyrhizobium TaxID=374 RepID=UPI000462FFCF|nr:MULTISPECIES: hypothetical protein [Bradyrhizobium]KIU44865.1 signal peptide protein [Bradyrhizobium elkanii]OCX26628.1 hypothetical protein QU42_35935 [Bradyrhizobium sp. UASWS1016]
MTINRTVALSWVLMLAPAVAAAQAPPAPATPPAQTAPPAPSRAVQNQNCAPQQPSHPGAAASEGTTTGQGAQPLGDKLAKSDGVLCPPAGVDPEMRAPTPQGGNTPVIPPPGSPGGDPSVRPK